MKFGFQLPTGREGISLPTPFFRPDDFLSMAITAEWLGYDSLWGNDHYTSPNYVREELVDKCPNFYELLTVLTAVAAVTHRIEIGTSILVLTMRDIVSVARQVATLDQLSNGRFMLGVGLGTYKEELASAYPDRVRKNRGAMLEEGLELLRRLLTENAVTFNGRYFRTANLDLCPKPFQNPFPILIGGHHINGIDRTIRYGQGWIPGWKPYKDLQEMISLLREKAVNAGRNPDQLIIAPHFSCLVARTMEEAEQRYLQSGVVRHRISQGYSKEKLATTIEYNLIGSPDVILEKVERLRAIGVNHIAALSFSIDTVTEFSEQVHYFAEAIMRPYRKSHGEDQEQHG